MPVCVLIPAYNAAATILSVAEEVLACGLPLLVVDDGSVDGSAEQIAHLPLTLLRHGSNRGKGAALRTGFTHALAHGFSGVVTVDADGQHDLSAIPQLLESADAQGVDILIASRAVQFEQMAGLRKYWNRFGVWCMARRTGFRITDSQSGFRYYSARLLADVELTAHGYDLEMELLMKAWRGGFRVDSLSVPARVADGRSTSHYRAVPDTWRICMTFLKYM